MNGREEQSDGETCTLIKTNQKKAGVAIFISGNTDFKASKMIRDKDKHNNKEGKPPRRHNSTSGVCA